MTSTTSLVVAAILIIMLGISVYKILEMIRQGSRMIVQAALKRYASDFGLKFWTDNSPYHQELANLTGRSTDAISNVLLRDLRDAEFVWFEELVHTGKSLSYGTRIAIRCKGSTFPKFALAKRSLAGCAPPWRAMQQVPLGEGALDARLKLFGDEPEKVRGLINSTQHEKIARAEFPSSMVIRGEGDWLLFNVNSFRTLYVWPAMRLVTEDFKIAISWMAKAASMARWFLPLEDDASFMVPSAKGLVVRGAGRDRGDLLLALATLGLWLAATFPGEVIEGDAAVVATGFLLALALGATVLTVSRLYRKALARTIDSLARGL